MLAVFKPQHFAPEGDVHEISDALHISRKTVETHRAHIKEKLNLKNAREVNRFAAQWVEGQA